MEFLETKVAEHKDNRRQQTLSFVSRAVIRLQNLFCLQCCCQDPGLLSVSVLVGDGWGRSNTWKAFKVFYIFLPECLRFFRYILWIGMVVNGKYCHGNDSNWRHWIEEYFHSVRVKQWAPNHSHPHHEQQCHPHHHHPNPPSIQIWVNGASWNG